MGVGEGAAKGSDSFRIVKRPSMNSGVTGVTMALVLDHADFEQLQIHRRAGCTAVVAIHSTALGPAHGGIRRSGYPDLAAAIADALRLGEAMTMKCALAEVAAGGGKAVILDHPDLDRRQAYRLVGEAVAQLGGRFFTGPDVGTTADDLREVAAVTPHVAIGDGEDDLAGATAEGVLASLRALAVRLGLADLRGLRIAVQGTGAVGGRLCALLAAAGARLLVADRDEALAARVARACGAEVVPADAIVTAACDLLAPCALGGVLDGAAVAALRCRGVCGAANNVLADEAAGLLLHRRGIPMVPDFVASAGALIVGATRNLTGRPPAPGRVAAIGETAGAILDRSRAEDRPPRQVALALAQERLAAGR